MQGRATAKYVRVAPRKARLVVDTIRGKSVKEAEDILRFLPRGATEPVGKVLNSAKSNAINNFDLIEDRLFVSATFINEGPSLKRVLPRARGRGDIIKKRTSHITIIVEERETAKGGRNGK